MAQASVNLPDPLAQTQDPLASPDDLLSQLAGSEIDRLLAETAAEIPPDLGSKPAAAKPTAKAAAAADLPVDKQLDDLFNELEKPQNATKKEAAAGQSAGAPSSAAPMDGPNPPAAQIPAPEASDASAAKSDLLEDSVERAALLKAAGFEQPLDAAPGVDKDANPEGWERTALLDAAGFETPKFPAPAAPEETHGDEEDIAHKPTESLREYIPPLPIYLRLLQWVNSPLAETPRARSAVGKVAILTLVNAIAVLGYVLVFRKH